VTTPPELGLAQLMQELTPHPPRELTVADIATRLASASAHPPAPRRRRPARWAPLVAAASVVVVVVSAVAVEASHHSSPSGQHPVATIPAGPSPAIATAGPTSRPTTPATAITPLVGHPPPAQFVATSLTFATATNAWATGSAPCGASGANLCPVLARSVDGGRSWRVVRWIATTPVTGLTIDQIRFADASNGWLIATSAGGAEVGRLFATHNGGASWHAVALSNAVDVAAGDGTVWVTASGATAVLYRAPVGSDSFSKVADSAGTALAVVGDTAYAWRVSTLDTFAARLTVASSSGVAERTLPCIGADVAFAATSRDAADTVCGSEPGTGNQVKKIYASQDNAKTWSLVGQLPDDGYVATVLIDGSTLVATGGRMPIDVSRDGGTTWVENFADSADAGGFTDLAFLSSTFGYADGPLPGQFAVTSDGGLTWQLRSFS
jgi:hypothetical protein